MLRRLHSAPLRGLGKLAAARVTSLTPRVFSSVAAEKDAKKPYYVTTPIFYVNGAPHIGHLYSLLLTDSMARWRGLCGDDARLMTGTDEHGGKVADAAAAAGAESVKAFCDGVASQFSETWTQYGITPSITARTTDPEHVACVQQMWRVLYARGFIYKGAHEGWYCRSDETFYPEAQLILGEDGVRRAPSGHSLELVSEPNYMFKLSAFQQPLLEWLRQPSPPVHPPSRLNEVLAFVEGGLEDISVSRLASKVPWGVPVPGDEEHTVYVWLDALSVYLSSALRLAPPAADEPTVTPTGEPLPPGLSCRFWPPAAHVVGKDILKFHCVYWPAFLMAAGLPLPKAVVAHGHWTNGGIKMSKSLGNVVTPAQILADFSDDVDAARYALLRHGPARSDTSYDPAAMRGDVDGDLADALGNLAMRATAKVLLPGDGVGFPDPLEAHRTQAQLVQAQLGAGGEGASADSTGDEWFAPQSAIAALPVFAHSTNATAAADAPASGEADSTAAAAATLIRSCGALYAQVDSCLSRGQSELAVHHVAALARAANALVSEWKPWELRVPAATCADTRARLDWYLYCAIEAARVAALCLQPFAPTTAARVLDGLAVPAEHRDPKKFSRFGYRPPAGAVLGFAAPREVPFTKLAARKKEGETGMSAAEAKAASRAAKKARKEQRKEEKKEDKVE